MKTVERNLDVAGLFEAGGGSISLVQESMIGIGE